MSEKASVLKSVPADLPVAVIACLQNWHNTPGHIRRAVEALLEAVERTPAADPRNSNGYNEEDRTGCEDYK